MTTTTAVLTKAARSRTVNRYFTDEGFARLEAIMHTRRLDAGNYIFWEGEPADKLYYVISGRVKLIKTTEDGQEMILRILQAGDLFGEPGSPDEIIYSCGAEVILQAEIGVMSRLEVEALLYQHGDLAMEWMNWMGLMHRITQSKLRDLMLHGKSGALASTLIRMSNSFGEASPAGLRIQLKLTHSELAHLIGTTRESVNRLLGSFKEDGAISVVHGKIIIHDLPYLRRIAGCPQCPACPKEVCSL